VRTPRDGASNSLSSTSRASQKNNSHHRHHRHRSPTSVQTVTTSPYRRSCASTGRPASAGFPPFWNSFEVVVTTKLPAFWLRGVPCLSRSHPSVHLSWPWICLHCPLRLKTHGVENQTENNNVSIFSSILHYLQTNQTKTTNLTNHNCFCRSCASKNRPRNRTRSNRSRFRMTHGVENRRRFSTPCVFSLSLGSVLIQFFGLGSFANFSRGSGCRGAKQRQDPQYWCLDSRLCIAINVGRGLFTSQCIGCQLIPLTAK